MAGLNIVAGFESVRERIPVFLAAGDPVSRDGLASQLRGQGIELVDERQLDEDSVAVLISDEIDDQAVREIRALRRRGVQRIVVVATRVDDSGLLAAVEAGASGLLQRGQSTPVEPAHHPGHAAAAAPSDPLRRRYKRRAPRHRQQRRRPADAVHTLAAAPREPLKVSPFLRAQGSEPFCLWPPHVVPSSPYAAIVGAPRPPSLPYFPALCGVTH